MMDGDFFIGAALGTTLTKLALRYGAKVPKANQNKFDAEVMLIIASIIHLGKSGLPSKAITNDDKDRLLFCLRVLSDRTAPLIKIFNEQCRLALNDMLIAKELEETSTQKAKEKPGHQIQADDPITFMQLQSDRSGDLGENMFEMSLSQALMGGRTSGSDAVSINKLNKVTQLTGFSDPVYAEAYVHVNQYDIVLDVLIVNQTNDTLQNCTLEIATLGMYVLI